MSTLSKKKILIVDDEPHTLLLLQTRLEMNDYEVVTASDGIECIEKTLEEKPDLIVLDIMMPNKDGFSTLRELKNNEVTKHIPVILLSARGEMDLLDKGEALGAADYFIKPYESTELLKYIKRYLGTS